VEFLKPSYGITRDFEAVDVEAYGNNYEVRNATRTTDAALKYLGAAKDGEAPFFMLLHYFDMHAVYDPPQPFRARFAAPPDQASGPNRTRFGTREHLMALREGKLRLTPEWISRAEKLYDGEVAYNDAEIGRLLDGLAEMGLRENTIIVLCGDHGEEFLDHGGYEHGHTVYDELIHVPLLMAGPGIQKGLQVAQTVRLIDVLPTLCQAADVGPERTYVGRSLMPFLTGQGGESRRVLSHGNMWGEPYTAWRNGPWKLIVSESGERELYQVEEDPKEQNNRIGEPHSPTLPIDDLTTGLRAFEAAMAPLGKGSDVKLTEAQRKALEASGYGGGDH